MRRSMLNPVLAIAVAWCLLLTAQVQGASPMRVYFGTYTSGSQSQGIYLAQFDPETGELSAPKLAGVAVNPSFLALSASGRFLYAVGEISDFQGKPTGGVSAFAVDALSGELQLLNQQPSGGAGPCHVVLDASGRCVLVANYGGGSVACLALDAHGQLRPAATIIAHHGHSVNPQRQAGPHAHSINVDPSGKFAVSADLGLDQVLVYRLDPAQALLAPHDPPFAELAPGAGPRHLAFHPSGRWAYVNNEMACTVTAFAWDASGGRFTRLHTLPTLPDGIAGPEHSTAEVRVHPSGRFVYVSNRGHNSLAVFQVDQASGQLTAAGHTASGGRIPRNFNLAPDGKFLLAANQDSDNVVVFRIDAQTGALEPTGGSITVPRPVCVRFAPGSK